jgi:ABC-type sugar transport systems, ATPase components
LYIGNTLVNDVQPKDRNIAMVFQNYALYPQMTVYDNIAFSLRIKKLPKDEIDQKVRETAKILGIEQYLDRLPKALSGGQRQRVALGRAIVRDSQVFLLDEPLSNLDAKLRTQMRTEITKLHKKFQTTFIYVTHDQVEAMTMGTRIVVMKDGFIQQIDTPQNLYSYPKNKFVAGFIGTPQMNFYDAKLKYDNDKIVIEFIGKKISVKAEKLMKIDPEYLDGRTVCIGFRPQHITNTPDFVESHPDTVIDFKVQVTEELGSETNVFGDLKLNNKEEYISDTSTTVIARSDPAFPVQSDEIVKFAIDPDHIQLFDKDTEISIIPRIPELNKISVCYNGNINIYGFNISLPDAIAHKLTVNQNYICNIPSAAFYPCETGKIEANVYKEEIIGNKKLLTLLINRNVLFAIVDKNIIAKDKMHFDIDMKAISFHQNKNEILAALPTENKIYGTICKRKIKGNVTYGYKIGNDIIEIDTDTINRLINAAGRKIFSMEVVFSFSLYSGNAYDNGIKACYTETLDYGNEKFDAYDICGSRVYVPILKCKSNI